MHTSTVAVMVLDADDNEVIEIKESDIVVRTTKDSGAGGQHRNKTESCVYMKHIPTNIEVKAAKKSQIQNRKVARKLLEERVIDYYENNSARETGEIRTQKKPSGTRGDKVRTYKVKENIVINHLNGKRAQLKKVLKGGLGKLY